MKLTTFREANEASISYKTYSILFIMQNYTEFYELISLILITGRKSYLKNEIVYNYLRLLQIYNTMNH